jgi:hypothetical protein
VNTFDTPVLFLIFNRPAQTRRVLDQIRKARPSQLFIAADGPRPQVAADAENCRLTRLIADEVDWPCEVKTMFRDENLGCKRAIGSAINWFFDNVEEGIIFEDDCLPDPSFFEFCSGLLARYRHDERVMMITGNNFQFGIKRGEASYYFSRLANIWGWATWRRAWNRFDGELKTFPQFMQQRQMENLFSDALTKRLWTEKIQDVYEGGNSWAFPWVYTILKENGLCVCPNVNLVENIGFGGGATHASNSGSVFANIKAESMPRITHPEFVLPDLKADVHFSHIMAKDQLVPKKLKQRLKYEIKRFLRASLSDRQYNQLKELKRGKE